MTSQLLALTLLTSTLIPTVAAAGPAAAPAPIAINDNRTPAGTLADGTLTLDLRADLGLWWPEGPAGPSLTVQAFASGTGPLQVPSPLVRVPEGTAIVARVTNDLEVPLELHGLCTHDGSGCATLDVAPHATREVRFVAGRPGTYHYWATTTRLPLSFRSVGDTQLSGAFIVDAAGAPVNDRVLVVTDWTSLTMEDVRKLTASDNIEKLFREIDPKYTFLINGRSWPANERLEYDLNDLVTWRVVNLSSQQHPLHLHGFYFEVDEFGDGTTAAAVPAGARQQVVTQLMPAGGTMRMTWKAERPGNWLFHCHIADHVAPQRHLGPAPDVHDQHAGHGDHGAMASMAGMVLGVTIRDTGHAAAPATAPAPARAITLEMKTGPGRTGPVYGFALNADSAGMPPSSLAVPGPTLALRKGEPVEITLVNTLPEATAIHWHGIELDSYFDGVHGWSGAGAQVTPMIEPGERFTVKFTPPRSGTFIYHTHLHDGPQLTGGMYGALIVLDAGETFDPVTDHVLVIGRRGAAPMSTTVLNGETEPSWILKAGVRHRLRFVNITPNDVFMVSLATASDPVQWCPITKDGAPVPAGATASRPALQRIAVGETYDFEYDAPIGRQSLWLNVQTPAGKWQVQGRVLVK